MKRKKELDMASLKIMTIPINNHNVKYIVEQSTPITKAQAKEVGEFILKLEGQR